METTIGKNQLIILASGLDPESVIKVYTHVSGKYGGIVDQTITFTIERRLGFKDYGPDGGYYIDFNEKD